MSTDIRLSLIDIHNKEILGMIVLDDDRDITLNMAKAELLQKYPPNEYASYFEINRFSPRWEQLDEIEKNR
jgi:hypothetical protein